VQIKLSIPALIDEHKGIGSVENICTDSNELEHTEQVVVLFIDEEHLALKLGKKVKIASKRYNKNSCASCSWRR